MAASGATPAPPKPIVVDKYQFKRDGQKYLTGNARTRIYLYDVQSRKLEPLTSDGDYDENNPNWSPDGSRIAFVSNHDKDWERTRNSDVFVVDAKPGSKSRKLTTSLGTDGGALAWSPDGTLIAYGQGSAPKFDFHNLNRLTVVPASGGAPRVLTESLDRGTSSPMFTEDGRSIVFTVAADRTQYLARIAVTGGTVERSDRRSEGGERAVARERTHGGDCYRRIPRRQRFTPSNRPELRKLTTHNDALVAELEFVPAEDISFKSKDGTEVQALVTKPIGYQAGRRYPTLVRIHGGPTGQDAHSFQFERQLFAAHGYVVLNVNYRGSSGRGAKFSESIFADWGNLEVDDVLAAVDYVVAQGIADPEQAGHRRLELRRRVDRLRHCQRHALQGGDQRRRQRESHFAVRPRPVHVPLRQRVRAAVEEP